MVELFQESKKILDKYSIETVRLQILLAEKCRTLSLEESSIEFQDVAKLNAKIVIYYTVMKNIDANIALLHKYIDSDFDFKFKGDEIIKLEVDNDTPLSDILINKDQRYVNEAALESKNGLSSVYTLKISVIFTLLINKLLQISYPTSAINLIEKIFSIGLSIVKLVLTGLKLGSVVQAIVSVRLKLVLHYFKNINYISYELVQVFD